MTAPSTAPDGYRYGDDREILVHVVAESGWMTAFDGGLTGFALCGAGLDRPAPWPVFPTP